MSKLNQTIAIESSTKTRANATMSEIYKAVQHPALFEGFNKRYHPLDDEGERFPDESKNVQMRAEQTLRSAVSALTGLFDVTATKDYGNCRARADVVVDGKVILEGVPVTYLLFLEKQLTDLHTLASKMPVLDPADDWKLDTATSLYRTEPTMTIRTKKVQRSLVLLAPTDKHPGQAQMITEDQTVGNWEQTKFSGAWPASVRDRTIARIEKLQHAVKFAREEANTLAVDDQSVGERVFGWLLGG